MKQIVLIFSALICMLGAGAQTPKKPAQLDLSRAGDHIMIQLSNDHWTGTPDSIDSHMSGFARGANFYVMLDKPFKGNPKLSVAFGVGISTSNMFFKTMAVDIKSTNTKLPFLNLDSLNHFKKYKLTTAFLEVPIELRFTKDPFNDKKSLKFALGIKVGTMLSAHTKGKTLQDKNNKTINSFIAEENSKRFFNSTRLSTTARIGYGNFGLFGSYQINNLFKDGVAAAIKPFQVGITLSGL